MTGYVIKLEGDNQYLRIIGNVVRGNHMRFVQDVYQATFIDEKDKAFQIMHEFAFPVAVHYYNNGKHIGRIG